jgi:hypothetical protein
MPTSLQTPTPHITNCSGYSSARRKGCHSSREVQTPVRKSPLQSLRCHKGKRWAHPVLMSTTGKCVTGKIRLQFCVGVRILLIRLCACMRACVCHEFPFKVPEIKIYLHVLFHFYFECSKFKIQILWQNCWPSEWNPGIMAWQWIKYIPFPSVHTYITLHYIPWIQS